MLQREAEENTITAAEVERGVRHRRKRFDEHLLAGLARFQAADAREVPGDLLLVLPATDRRYVTERLIHAACTSSRACS